MEDGKAKKSRAWHVKKTKNVKIHSLNKNHLKTLPYLGNQSRPVGQHRNDLIKCHFWHETWFFMMKIRGAVAPQFPWGNEKKE